MKKTALTTLSLLALSSASFAADLPSKKSPPPAPAPSWSGFYAGLNAGGIWANNRALNNTSTYSLVNGNTAFADTAVLLSGNVPASATNSFIGGGQIGYNYQIDNLSKVKFLAGVEADIQGITGSGGNSGRSSVSTLTVSPQNYAFINQQASTSLSYLGTVRGRFGIILIPSILIYGTGGLAYGQANVSMTNFAAWNNSWQGGYGNQSNTQVGWTAGGGIEWLFAQNWSAKAEYLYYDVGKVQGSFTNSGNDSGNAILASQTNYSTRYNGNLLRAGVNYHFNWGKPASVVASY